MRVNSPKVVKGSVAFEIAWSDLEFAVVKSNLMVMGFQVGRSDVEWHCFFFSGELNAKKWLWYVASHGGWVLAKKQIPVQQPWIQQRWIQAACSHCSRNPKHGARQVDDAMNEVQAIQG